VSFSGPALQMIFYVVQDKRKSSAHCNIKPTTARIDCNLKFHKLFPHATQEDSTRHWRKLVRVRTMMSFNRFRWIKFSRSVTRERERERDLQLLASYWTPWCQDMRMHHRRSCLKTWLMTGARRQLFVMYKKQGRTSTSATYHFRFKILFLYKFLIILRILWIYIVSFLFYLDLLSFLRSCSVFCRWIWNSQFTLIFNCFYATVSSLSLCIYIVLWTWLLNSWEACIVFFLYNFCPLFTNKLGNFWKYSPSYRYLEIEKKNALMRNCA
jgi:hypothetical protein